MDVERLIVILIAIATQFFEFSLNYGRKMGLKYRIKIEKTLDFSRVFGCRCDGIRTHDLCVPNAALYQAEPRTELMFFI